MKIHASEVTKRFGKLTALRGIDLDVGRGERVALVGPNGSGKTTLIRILMGMLAHEGTVELDGRAVSDRSHIAHKLAYAPQVAPQTSVPARDMIAAAASLRAISPGRITAIASRLGLEVDDLGRRPFRNLSGGMKQKLLLAMALAAPASLLILDEPTASLDAASRSRFFELYEELSEDTTLILCSHRLEEIRHMVGRVVALEEGRMVHDSPVAGFLAGRGSAVIELLVADEDSARRWLLARDFARGFGGWWARTVPQARKRALLAEALSSLGAALEDVSVRDLETVEVSRSTRHVA